MKCPNCGKEVSTPNNYNDPPISMWGYFGYEILFALPFVGNDTANHHSYYTRCFGSFWSSFWNST